MVANVMTTDIMVKDNFNDNLVANSHQKKNTTTKKFKNSQNFETI